MKSELKAKMCEYLISNGCVKPFDTIRHSYTKNRLNIRNGKNCVQSQNNISPTLDTRSDCLGVVVRMKNINKKIAPRLVGGVGNIWGTQYHQQNRIYDSEQVAMCHPASIPNGSYMYRIKGANMNYRIRKLTPRECGRLMDVKDSDITKIAKNQSESSQYHLYGDSIVVNVIKEIIKQML